MHIILGVSPVSVGPCMCAVRTQVTEDRPLKSAIAQPAQHRTSPAQDKAILSCHWNAAGVAQLVQRTANLTVARGQGRAASTASNGGAGTVLVPGTRTQCMEEQRRSGERRRVQYILYRVTQVNHGRGKFGKGNGQSTTFLRLVFKST